MLSLTQIATNRLIQNAMRITDVGETPFHLLEPILLRLNAKQLALLEENSSQIVPHSDKLWPNLIERDFPDRPIYQNRKLNSISNVNDTNKNGIGSMPNKALYYRYQKEKELFRSTSAARLKAINEKLQREKLAKAIVTVPQILRDPTVSRRSYSRPVYRSNVLEKARKDTMKTWSRTNSRPTLGYRQPVLASPNLQLDHEYNRPIRRRPPTQFNTNATQRMEKERMQRISELKDINEKRKAQERLQRSKLKNDPKSSINTEDACKSRNNDYDCVSLAEPLANAEVRSKVSSPTKKPMSSIFLTRKRPRPGISTVRNQSRTLSIEKIDIDKVAKGPPSKLRAVKSSIFR